MEAPSARGRITIFIIGGVSLNEMRLVHTLAKDTGRDILIGMEEGEGGGRFLNGMGREGEEGGEEEGGNEARGIFIIGGVSLNGGEERGRRGGKKIVNFLFRIHPRDRPDYF
jgi:hypothetical protein